MQIRRGFNRLFQVAEEYEIVSKLGKLIEIILGYYFMKNQIKVKSSFKN